MSLQVEDSCSIVNFIVDLASLDNLGEFVDIDINLINTVNLTNFALKAISLITEDELRINNFSLIKSVIMRSQSQWIFTLLKIKLTHNQVLINVSIDIKLQFNFSMNSISISYIIILLVIFCLMIMSSQLSDLIWTLLTTVIQLFFSL